MSKDQSLTPGSPGFPCLRAIDELSSGMCAICLRRDRLFYMVNLSLYLFNPYSMKARVGVIALKPPWPKRSAHYSVSITFLSTDGTKM